MFEALFEDEDNIFGGSPRSKYMDIIFNANPSVVEVELEEQLRKLAAMEILLEEKMGEDYNVAEEVKRFIWNNADILDEKIKSLYIEHTGNILSKNE